MDLGCSTLKGLPKDFATSCAADGQKPVLQFFVVPQYVFFFFLSSEIAQEHLVSGHFMMLFSVHHLHCPCCFRVLNLPSSRVKTSFDAASVSWLPSTPFCSWLAFCSEPQRRDTDQPCVLICNNRDAVRVAAVGREKFC